MPTPSPDSHEARAGARQREMHETMESRIKELFQRYDRSGDGFLQMEELSRALKALGVSVANVSIESALAEIDTNADGKVSCREFADWARNGRLASEVRGAILRETGNVKAARIKEAFQRSGDGFLDMEELHTILKTLGTFTNHEVGSICADLDKSKDGQVSYEEFVSWVMSGAGGKEIAKAKALLAPSDNDGLEAVYFNFCGAAHSEMDGKSFLKMCRDCGLIDNNLTETYVDLIFSNTKVKAKGQRSLTFTQFEIALELVAEKKGVATDRVRTIVLESTRPLLLGTKVDAVRLHDDKSTYTGIHAHGHGDRTLLIPSSISAGPSKGEASAEFVKPRAPQKVIAQQVAPSDMPIDKRNVWKTFGIDSRAGRTLKRLYNSDYCPETYPSRGHARSRRRPPEHDTYVAVNALHGLSAGLHFRRSMHLPDLCKDPHQHVPWGACVQGERMDACWLKVGDLFLPTEVGSVRLLRKWQGPGDPPQAGSADLVRATSLPAIRELHKQSMSDMSVLGASYGQHRRELIT